MAAARIEIENTNNSWVAEVEIPHGIRIARRRIIAESLKSCLEQIWNLYEAAKSVPVDETNLGETALRLRTQIAERRKAGETVATLPMSEAELKQFISSGAGLDLWERRTPGKPILFEGAVFAVPTDPKPGEKWSWRVVAPDEPVAAAAAEVAEPPVDDDPSAPNHRGRATAAGFWSKCRCAECETKRDEANGRVTSAAA